MGLKKTIAYTLLIACSACRPAHQPEDAPAYHNPLVQPLTDAIAQDPGNAVLFFQRAEALSRVHEPALARKDLQQAVRLDSLNPQYMQALGMLALNSHHAKEAIAVFRKCLQMVPGHVQTRLLLSNAYLEDGDTAAAQAVITDIRKADPGYPGVCYVQAQIKAAEGDTAAAVSLLDTALAANPGDYAASRQLGIWLSRNGDPRAVTQFRKTFSMDTTDVTPLVELGRFYERRGAIRQAKDAYYTCILKDPDYTDALLQMGKILLRQDSVSKALRQFNIAIQTMPNSAEAYFEKGLCFERLQQPDSARQAFGQALVFRPGYPEAKAGWERVKGK